MICHLALDLLMLAFFDGCPARTCLDGESLSIGMDLGIT